MTTEATKRFTVITNKDFEEKEKLQTYQTSPMQENPLKEKLMKFVNNEAGRRFTVEDLLNW